MSASIHRAAVVVVREGTLLVIKRCNRGRRYAVLPGGGIEPGETPGVAALRELAEETGLVGVLDRHLWSLEGCDRLAHYFLVQVPVGQPVLGGPEVARQSGRNSYTPSWISIAALEEENVQPEELRALLRALLDRAPYGAPPGVASDICPGLST